MLGGCGLAGGVYPPSSPKGSENTGPCAMLSCVAAEYDGALFSEGLVARSAASPLLTLLYPPLVLPPRGLAPALFLLSAEGDGSFTRPANTSSGSDSSSSSLLFPSNGELLRSAKWSLKSFPSDDCPESCFGVGTAPLGRRGVITSSSSDSNSNTISGSLATFDLPSDFLALFLGLDGALCFCCDILGGMSKILLLGQWPGLNSSKRSAPQ